MKEKYITPEVANPEKILKEDLYDIALEIAGETFSFPGISDDGLRIMRGYEEDPYFELSGARPIDEVLKDCKEFGIRIVAFKSGTFVVPANCPSNAGDENSNTISLRHLHVTGSMDQNLAALIYNAKKK